MSDERKILITGFMGAGKTTTAHALGKLLACEVVDLDQFIGEREGLSPQEIIDVEGEMRFREVETLALNAALTESPARVISLGGGTWAIGQNRALVAEQNAFVVWLDAPFDLCWRRISGTGKHRPFARDREKARQRYDERRSLYQLATLRVAVTELKRPETAAAEIADTLHELETDLPEDKTL